MSLHLTVAVTWLLVERERIAAEPITLRRPVAQTLGSHGDQATAQDVQASLDMTYKRREMQL